MIGLVIVIALIIASFTTTTLEIAKAYRQPEGEPIRLQSIPTPEQKQVDEKVKAQWLADFNRLLKGSQESSKELPAEN